MTAADTNNAPMVDFGNPMSYAALQYANKVSFMTTATKSAGAPGGGGVQIQTNFDHYTGSIRLYTSHFHNKQSVTSPNAVSIAIWPLDDFEGRCYPDLAPPEWLMRSYRHGDVTKERYIEVYRSQLNKLDPKKVAADLGPGAILLCWCKPKSFCHRQLVAQWLREAGFEVAEVM